MRILILELKQGACQSWFTVIIFITIYEKYFSGIISGKNKVNDIQPTEDAMQYGPQHRLISGPGSYYCNYSA